MRVYYISDGRLKKSIGLKNQSNRMRIECRDGHNSLLYLRSNQLQSQKIHEIFEGVLDFYCEGLQSLNKGLNVGNEVEIVLDFRSQSGETAGENSEIVTISNITFKLSGERRIYKSAGGLGGEFMSTKPLQK